MDSLPSEVKRRIRTLQEIRTGSELSTSHDTDPLPFPLRLAESGIRNTPRSIGLQIYR